MFHKIINYCEDQFPQRLSKMNNLKNLFKIIIVLSNNKICPISRKKRRTVSMKNLKFQDNQELLGFQRWDNKA